MGCRVISRTTEIGSNIVEIGKSVAVRLTRITICGEYFCHSADLSHSTMKLMFATLIATVKSRTWSFGAEMMVTGISPNDRFIINIHYEVLALPHLSAGRQ